MNDAWFLFASCLPALKPIQSDEWEISGEIVKWHSIVVIAVRCKTHAAGWFTTSAFWHVIHFIHSFIHCTAHFAAQRRAQVDRDSCRMIWWGEVIDCICQLILLSVLPLQLVLLQSIKGPYLWRINNSPGNDFLHQCAPENRYPPIYIICTARLKWMGIARGESHTGPDRQISSLSRSPH